MFSDSVEQYSPNKRYRLTFHNFEEPRMCYSICKFDLTDLQTYESIEFEPLWAIGIGQKGFSWSENEKFLSIPITSYPTEDFLIYNIENRQFSSLRFNNCWVLNGHCHNNYIEIEYDENVPGENLKYPTKNFSKPGNIKFNLSELKWTDIEYLNEFNNLNRDVPIHEFKLINHGWRPFRGDLPKNTEVLVWELREFARYGDEQSIEWFAEIEAKTSDINYWINASHYLGPKARK